MGEPACVGWSKLTARSTEANSLKLGKNHSILRTLLVLETLLRTAEANPRAGRQAIPVISPEPISPLSWAGQEGRSLDRRGWARAPRDREEAGGDYYWFWIGAHQEYDRLLTRLT